MIKPIPINKIYTLSDLHHGSLHSKYTLHHQRQKVRTLTVPIEFRRNPIYQLNPVQVISVMILNKHLNKKDVFPIQLKIALLHGSTLYSPF